MDYLIDACVDWFSHTEVKIEIELGNRGNHYDFIRELMTTLSELKNKKIVILGAGLTGISCARFFHRHDISFSINDSRDNFFSRLADEKSLVGKQCIDGQWNGGLIASADILMVSPGLDLNSKALSKLIKPHTEVIGDVELYCQLTSTPTIAVTGSNGKSTVVSLLEHVGKSLGKNVALGGNIGEPVLDLLSGNSSETAKSLDMLILELSSFQLETLKSMKADAASVLNVTDDHLDRHKTLANYASIKQRIYAQSKNTVSNRQDKLTNVPTNISADDSAQHLSFGIDKPSNGQFGLVEESGHSYLAFGDQLLIAIDELPLAGQHNAQNYLAVLALGLEVNWPLKEMVASFEGFDGLAHRCERVKSTDNIHWINDSKATNVGATIAAIEGISPILEQSSQLILIMGGEGKGADFSPLQKVFSDHVAKVIAIGKSGKELATMSKNGIFVDTLKQAVAEAKKAANTGDTVLLSPACASIDMFTNYVERGNAFVDAVREAS